jgi:DNA topoisomerase-3
LKLVICEKPSVAKATAAVLGANKRNDGYIEGSGYIVSWCYGHLVELAPPTDYGEEYRHWDKDALPILPEEWKYTAQKDKKEQIGILRSLMARSDVESVVNACDAGREGELIFRLVYEYCGCRKPVQRLWISSMEDAAIRKGFAELKDGTEYENLYNAALCRARADWAVGMNVTRLLSCLYMSTLPVGRVMSPTLAMIVAREEAVSSFISEPFYTTVIDTGSFLASGERLKTSGEAEAMRLACDGSDAAVISVEKKEKSEAPPKLYDLTTLQRDANRLLGYTAQETLAYAQSLYEKKLITYPRTDSRYITGDMEATALSVVGTVGDVFPFADASFTPDLSCVINDAKVSDHHAIIPTKECVKADLGSVPSGERTLLTLIAAGLLCAVGEAHRFEAVTAILECGKNRFTAKGKTVMQNGWRAIDRSFRASLKESPDDGSGSDDTALPDLSDGQVFSSISASVREGKTSPPKRYTDDTLLAAMETAGAEDFPDDAERKGLGTPATRAGVIEKLIRTGFAERKKKMIVPTGKGKDIIPILPDEIKSPRLTAEWEQQLKKVERGEVTGRDFMDGITSLIKGIIAAHGEPLPEYASLFVQRPEADAVGTCPRCGEGVVENAKGFFCSSRACRFALWKDSRFWSAKGKKLNEKIAAALLSDGRVFFSDLKSKKSGNTYSATIILDDNGERVNYRMEFENKSDGRKTA